MTATTLCILPTGWELVRFKAPAGAAVAWDAYQWVRSVDIRRARAAAAEIAARRGRPRLIQ